MMSVVSNEKFGNISSLVGFVSCTIDQSEKKSFESLSVTQKMYHLELSTIRVRVRLTYELAASNATTTKTGIAVNIEQHSYRPFDHYHTVSVVTTVSADPDADAPLSATVSSTGPCRANCAA